MRHLFFEIYEYLMFEKNFFYLDDSARLKRTGKIYDRYF